MEQTITNPVIRDQVTFMQTACTTNGRITTLQVTLMPGGSTPLHYHNNFSETFIVISGALTITLKNKSLVLHAGQKLTVEKKQPHRFSNESTSEAIFTTVIIPGSEGFENALRILYGLAEDRKTDNKGIPKNLMALAVISKTSDMHPVGAAMIMTPLFGILNLMARVSGLRRRLFKKYCTA